MRYFREESIADLNRLHRKRWKWDGDAGHILQGEWDVMLKACGGKCLCCGDEGRLTIDHVKPMEFSGKNEADNIQPLCGGCNSKKRQKEIDYRPKNWPFLKINRLTHLTEL